MNKEMNYLNARDFGACGSAFETIGHAVAGSSRIEVENIGDFAVGQQLKMFGCLPRCDSLQLMGPNGTHCKYRGIDGEVELRGWDASNGDHVAYFLDIDPRNPSVFRWTDDHARSWHNDVPIDGQWHTLSGGLEVRFNDFDWSKGWVVTIVMRASMVTKITAIEGNTLTVDQIPQRTCTDRIIHSDTLALQTAIDTALAEGADLWIPEGHYRLSDSLVVQDARSITIRGASPERTVLDIGLGGIGIEQQGGSCLVLRGGEEVNVYDLGFRGAVGFDRRDQTGHLPTKGATGLWGFYFMKCNAMSIWSTRRVYVENCHARKMSAECFYSASAHRTPDEEPENYTTSITYMRCSVEDCTRNAFNNNDKAENTHLIDCRIRDVGGCTWEGASRFVQMRGCYVRNAGTIGMGNIRSRDQQYEKLGSGQHVIADNTFESCCCYGLSMLGVGACASQVIIKGNNFVNFNSDAIRVTGNTESRDLPCRNVIITGNTFDMTAEETPSSKRCAIEIASQDVTVSDNQIYSTVHDDLVTAIRLREDAQGVIIHDNLVRGCGTFIENYPLEGIVGEVIDDRHFHRDQSDYYICALTILRRRSHRYRGWLVCWDKGDQSVMEDFDPETCIFTLKEPRSMQPGDKFILKPRYADGRIMEERIIHDNLVL